MKVRNLNGSTETYLVEVKPKAQVEGPKPQKTRTKKYITEVATYATNQAKWKAAEEFCRDRFWKFKIITEIGFQGLMFSWKNIKGREYPRQI